MTILLQGITAWIKPNSWFFLSKYSDFCKKNDKLVGKFSTSILFQEDSFEHKEQINILCLLIASLRWQNNVYCTPINDGRKDVKTPSVLSTLFDRCQCNSVQDSTQYRRVSVSFCNICAAKAILFWRTYWNATRTFSIFRSILIKLGTKYLQIGPRQSSRHSDSLRAGRSGHRIPVEARFSARGQIGPGAKPSFYAMGAGLFLRVKRQRRGVNHPPHLAQRLKK